ncbi:MAG: sulfite oxidase [Bauldia sp.]|uniref:sulfite oxidase n=1 Tax=Bauldia sp. TaxID=2575872 RepID=UPI001DDA08CF|nr:sulfite oxidase [Bauldia sp.]MCB1494611.1 sulfite oxidase [Bauldia sp.]
MGHRLSGRGVSRREFGLLAGAAGLSFGLSPAALRTALAEDAPNAAQIIAGKSPDMIILNAQLGVMETPLNLLRQHAHTPKEILFNRLHYPHEGDASWYATTEPPGAPRREDWRISIDGLVERTRSLSIADLEGMDQVKRVMVIQCAGNGRSFYAAKEKVAGGQWKNGGMGNIEWEGVPLKPLLADQEVAPSSFARWLTASGWDQPATFEGSDFAKSYPVSDPALDNAILALKMNGEPIPAVHGGPVRLIIPGYYGNMNVKFLTALSFAAEQSPSAFQSVGYRMPLVPVEPGQFEANDYTIYNSVPTYGQKIKSVIFSPLPEDNAKAGEVEISGVAFNDGLAQITSVEVTADGGASWMSADIKPPESPWAWHHWSTKAMLTSGTNKLMSRATDALGRTQPMDGLTRWNPRGYEWNGLDVVEIAA